MERSHDYQARRFRARAEEIRTMADGMSTPEGRRTILEIAATYDKLADNFEALAARDLKRSTASD